MTQKGFKCKFTAILRNKILLSVSIIFLFCFSGCAIQLKNFAEFAPFNHPETKLKKIRLPLIIVPGLKGSLLKKGDKEIWGVSYRAAFLQKFDDLQFNLSPQIEKNFQEFKSYYYEDRQIESGGIMEDYKISLPGVHLFKVSIYHNLTKILMNTGGYTVGKDLFTFSYDWRLDNRISAAYLAKMVKDCQEKYRSFLEETLGDEFNNYWAKLNQKELLTKDGRVKVNVVAHSMGGLVSRYYLQMLGGWRTVNKLVMLGTPNLGAMDSLKALAEGEYPESLFPLYPKYKTRPVIFSWPSVYQVLPRYPNSLKKQNGDPVTNLENWGLSSLEISSYSLNKALKNWKNYNLIPAIIKEDNEVVLKFLEEQLKDAVKFHNSINGTFDKNYEETKLGRIKTFIGFDFHKDFHSGPVGTPFIIFGDHCSPTVKTALLSAKGSNGPHLVFENPKQDEPGGRSVTYGDGRVPIVSLKPQGRDQRRDFQFLICEDHLGLVKNKTFQYNLLRELIGQTSDINSNTRP
jgi:hypothetical protein